MLFDEMVEVLEAAEQTKRKPGRPSELSVADQLLLTLQYWREYRTLFHVGACFGGMNPLPSGS
ncbi:MAG: transposase family protein [Gammaproteobacteria bacterium]